MNSTRHAVQKSSLSLLLFSPVSVDLIRDIKDPEHPHTLEELNVVSEECITLQYRTSTPAGDHVLSTTGPSHQGGSISSQGALTSSQGASTSTGNSTEGASITSQQRGEQGELGNRCTLQWELLMFTPGLQYLCMACIYKVTHLPHEQEVNV